MSMENKDFAALFTRIARLLEVKGEDRFKTAAYERAAATIAGMETPLEHLTEKELINLPGIGKAIASKILELVGTGKLEFLEQLEKEVPTSLMELLEIPGVGPRRASLFWKTCNVQTVDDLEAAAQSGQLRQLPGIGQNTEAQILSNIQAWRITKQH